MSSRKLNGLTIGTGRFRGQIIIHLSVSLGVGHQTRTVVKNLPALRENDVMQQVISTLSASTSRLDPWVIVAEAFSVGKRASTNLGRFGPRCARTLVRVLGFASLLRLAQDRV